MGTRLAVFLLAPCALLAQGPPCDKTPAYSPCEMAFDLAAPEAAANPNPYVTVQLRVEFRSPRMRTYAMPAFWDGGGRMVVRFSPTEAGRWDYHVTSNIASWNDKEGTFTAAASDSPGFIRPAEVRHWAYTERNLPHLWMGATELRFASLPEADFRAVVDTRAAQRFNHLRGLAFAEGPAGAYQSADSPNLDWFHRLDQRVRSQPEGPRRRPYPGLPPGRSLYPVHHPRPARPLRALSRRALCAVQRHLAGRPGVRNRSQRARLASRIGRRSARSRSVPAPANQRRSHHLRAVPGRPLDGFRRLRPRRR